LPAIETSRLTLIAATPEALRAELARAGFAAALGADVPSDWPPSPDYDANAIGYTLALQEREPAALEWGCRYFLLKGARPMLVGVGGYTGPAKDRQIEIGYAVMPSHRRAGLASEAAAALVRHAFAASDVERVIAYTLAHLDSSIGVLTKCGFQFDGEGPEAGTVRYAIARS